MGLSIACVPDGRRGSTLAGNGRGPNPNMNPDTGLDAGSATNPDATPVIPIDAGFSEAGVPVDTGPRPPPIDAGVGGFDAVVVTPRYDECTSFQTQFSIDIIVNDSRNATVQRNPPLTTFMIPFARDANLQSLNALTVLDQNGARLPAQFEALSRYDDHPESCTAPVRHAYAFVRAAPAPGSNVRWTVRHDPASVGETTPLSVNEMAGAWEIATGPAIFTVRRDRFDGLSKVVVGGVTVSEITGNVGSAGFMLGHNGDKSSHSMPWYFEMERSGPQLVTIAARGYYGNGPGDRDLGYTVRLTFYAGSAAVKIDHTVYHGDVEDFGSAGATNTVNIDYARMRIPLAAAPSAISARIDQQMHMPSAAGDVRVEQRKRTLQQHAIRSRIRAGATDVQTGARASAPFLAASVGSNIVVATLDRMAIREPQAIAYTQASQSLDLDFISERITVGGARGIYGRAVVDFSAAGDIATRATALQLHAERPLLGATSPAHVNTTGTIGPYAIDTTRFQNLYDTLDYVHGRTRDYFTEYRITGLQIWPDLPRNTCSISGNCNDERQRLYGGGENNYWNWAKPGIDEFFRTGRNDYIYDFSLGQAMLFAETTAYRLYHDRLNDSSLTGMAPCYGDWYGYQNDAREGLNQRRDRCPGDYTYNKHLKMAYLATADRRFVDFFEEAGLANTDAFQVPPPVQTDGYFELTFARLSFQRLENVMNGAEFSRDAQISSHVRGGLRSFVDTMLQRVLLGGHACWVSGTGSNSAIALGRCDSAQGWMMPSAIEFSRRAASFMNHQGMQQWLMEHIVTAGRHYAVLDARGLPDYSKRDQNSPNDADNGWRTLYECSNANAQQGVVNSSCRKVTDFEFDGRFYTNGMMAFLNAFGLLLGANPDDPERICQWLQGTYGVHLPIMIADTFLNNDLYWGKSSGQAFNMAPQAAGALIEFCP